MTIWCARYTHGIVDFGRSTEFVRLMLASHKSKLHPITSSCGCCMSVIVDDV